MEEHAGSFGEQLRQFRVRAGLSQAELAKRANLSPAAVTTLERGVRSLPYARTVQALSDALGLSAAEHAELAAAPHRSARSRPPPASVLDEQLAQAAPPLPVWLTSFVGREVEVEVVRSRLDPDEAAERLLTLVGPGGVGKTRLAVAAAAALGPAYPDGIVFVDLAPVLDARLVPASIARALGLRQSGGRSARELLLEYLRQRRVLLVLDNFEHLLEAAPLVPELLRQCPRVAVLVTSRMALHTQGEQRFVVAPLATSSAEARTAEQTISTSPAAQLFLERAQAVAPGYGIDVQNAPVIAEICRRLDGIPLAIELAAARAGLLRPDALLRRLERRLPLLTGGARDLPARQQTLRKTLTWSHDLLDPGAQVLFRRLAVFAGGWTLEAAEAVCADADRPAEEVLDRLQVLVDSNLVRRLEAIADEARFGMFATVREFAEEMLDTRGEEHDQRRRHATYFLALAEQAEPRLRGADQRIWFDRLDAELDNMRAVLAWARSSSHVESGLRLAVALAAFWENRGYLREAREWLETLLGELAQPETPYLLGLQAGALAITGWTAFLQGDYQAAAPYAKQSLAQWRTLGQVGNSPVALNTLAYVAGLEGDRPRQEALFRQSLAVYQAQGDTAGSAAVLSWLGTLRRGEGDLDAATALLDESLRLYQVTGTIDGMAYDLLHLGGVATARQDFEGARALFERSLAFYEGLGDRLNTAYVLGALASLAARRGNFEPARTQCEQAVALFRQVGDRRGVAEELRLLGHVAALQGDDRCAAVAYAECLALAGAMRQVDLAFSLEGLALALARVGARERGRGRIEGAVRLLGAAAALRERLGAAATPSASVTLPIVTHEEYGRQVVAARTALGAPAFERAWSAGVLLSLDDALDEALATAAPELRSWAAARSALPRGGAMSRVKHRLSSHRRR